MEKIFLFDIGNVIFEEPNSRKAYDNLKCNCSFEEFEQIFRHSKLYFDAETGLIGTNYYIDELKRLTKTTVTYEEYIKCHNASKGVVYQDTINLINDLKKEGYKIGVLSNLKRIDVEYFKSIIDTNIFDYEFYSCYLNMMKPNSDIFEHVAKIVNTQNNEVYFFDDLERNINEANNHGFIGICATGKTIKEKYNNLK